MGKTTIEWTEYSWNPLRGTKGKWHCTKVSPGCANCYAERMNQRFGGPAYTVGADTLRLDEKALTLPLRWRKPRMVFVCSMTDLFHEDVTDRMIDSVFTTILFSPRHTFQVLTKRPERMRDAVSQWLADTDAELPNVWLGVSVESPDYYSRIVTLRAIPAAVHWISVEPMLAPMPDIPLDGIDWVVVGGESGPKARPMNPQWARHVRDQCIAAGVAFHFKQWGEWCPAFVAGESFALGRKFPTGCAVDRGNTGMWRIGKRAAGRLLDSREWNQYPTPPSGGKEG